MTHFTNRKCAWDACHRHLGSNTNSELCPKHRKMVYDSERMLRKIERRNQLAADQGYMCPCGDPLGEDVVLDHDHSCCGSNKSTANLCGNCDRAAMHRNCNLIIGYAKDDPKRLRALADFLSRAKDM